MTIKMNTILLLVMAGVLVTLGDLALAHWSRAGQILFVLLGVVLNLFGILLYAQTLNSESVGIATGIFLGLNILAVTLGGIFLFGESINLPRIIGLLILTGSIIFIEIMR